MSFIQFQDIDYSSRFIQGKIRNLEISPFYGKEHTDSGRHYPIYYPSFYTSILFFAVS